MEVLSSSGKYQVARNTGQIVITKLQLARSNSQVARVTIMTVMVINIMIIISIETIITMIWQHADSLLPSLPCPRPNIIDLGAVHEAKYFIKKMRTLGSRAEYVESDGMKRMCEWAMTPDSAKKCRTLEAHPTGDSL